MEAHTSLPVVQVGASVDRDRWMRRARLLAWLGVGWHAIEATVAIGAGVVAGSIALIGFGADSLIESGAGFVVLWRFAVSRAASEDAERRAQRLIAASFYLLAAYVGVEAVRSLIGGHEPHVSWVGIGLSVVTVAAALGAAVFAAKAAGTRENTTRRAARGSEKRFIITTILSWPMDECTEV